MILYVMTRLMWTRTRWTGSGQMSCTLRATAASTTLPVLSFVGKADVLSPEVAAKRKLLRKRVGAITQRIVRERVAPLVRARYPQLCGRSAARACTLCQSLIRRYLPDGRRSHGLHFDLQSAVTVVVSLSDHTRLLKCGGTTARHTGLLWPALNSLGSEPPRFASEAAAAPPGCAKAADSAP